MSVYITEAMEDAVGTELRRQVSFPVSASDIRRWATAVYFPEAPPPLFWDADYAATTAHGGIVAPEEFNPFAWMVADPPGERTGFAPNHQSMEAQLGLSEVDTQFMLNGGVETRHGVRMRPGDVITSVTVLSGYREREGRLGTMLFTESTSTWTNQDDETVRTSVSTVIRY